MRKKQLQVSIGILVSHDQTEYKRQGCRQAVSNNCRHICGGEGITDTQPDVLECVQSLSDRRCWAIEPMRRQILDEHCVRYDDFLPFVAYNRLVHLGVNYSSSRGYMMGFTAISLGHCTFWCLSWRTRSALC